MTHKTNWTPETTQTPLVNQGCAYNRCNLQWKQTVIFFGYTIHVCDLHSETSKLVPIFEATMKSEQKRRNQ